MASTSTSAPTSSRPTIAYIGASRGIGYAAFVALSKTRPDLHHILLLRSIESFKKRVEYTALSEEVVPRTTLFEGDAFNEEDVKRLIKEAGQGLEGIVYSVGPPDPESVVQTLLHGVQFTPADYTARGMFTLLKAVAPLPTPPKLVFVTAFGMGTKGRARLPFILRVLFNYMLTAAHHDKIAGELAVLKALKPAESASTSSLPRDFPDPTELKLAISSYESIPSSFLDPSRVLIVRPAVLTNAPPKGWSAYRVVQDGEEPKGGALWTISRNDVGGFIAAALAGGSEGAEKWWGHQVAVGY